MEDERPGYRSNPSLSSSDDDEDDFDDFSEYEGRRETNGQRRPVRLNQLFTQHLMC